ncbi:MAG: hypothetical protein WA081_04260 [Desulfosalsimonadaceae bacterium]
MYIPDSNLVLSIVQSNNKKQTLSGKHKHFLSVTKQAVARSWHQSQQWIPIDPILAIMELTKQNVTPNFNSYIKLYKDFFEGIYRVDDVAPEWVASTYLVTLKAHVSTHPSISRTIEAVYSFCPPEEKPTDIAAKESCKRFFNWIWRERESLTLIGGPLMYLAVYAFCGSPQARAFIKYSRRSAATAKNVAWDLLYWIMLEIDYHLDKYENSVVCTSDYALAELLSSRVNKGHRGQISISTEESSIESYGDFNPVKLKRLENTILEKEIFQMLAQLFMALELVEKNSTKFGFNELYAT